MKKIFLSAFIAMLAFSLFSCADNDKNNMIIPDEKEDHIPLFALSAPDDKKADASFYPLGSGFIYICATDSGSSASYIDIASESITNDIFSDAEKDNSNIRLFYGDDSFIAAGKSQYHICSAEKLLSNDRAFPEGHIRDMMLYDGIAFISCDEASGLIILEPFGFEESNEKYVLAPISALAGNEYPLAARGKNLYFTKKTGDSYDSVIKLWYGEEKTSPIYDGIFKDHKLLSNSNILINKDGKNFVFLDTEIGSAKEISFEKEYIGYSASSDFSIFAGLSLESGKYTIEIWDTASQKLLKRTSFDDKKINHDIELSADGKYLIFSVLSSDESDKTETVSYIKINDKKG